MLAIFLFALLALSAAQSTKRTYRVGVILRLPTDANRPPQFSTVGNVTTTASTATTSTPESVSFTTPNYTESTITQNYTESTSTVTPQRLREFSITTTTATNTIPFEHNFTESTTITPLADNFTLPNRTDIVTPQDTPDQTTSPNNINNNKCLTGPQQLIILDVPPRKILSVGDNGTFDGTLEGCKSECFAVGTQCRSLIYYSRGTSAATDGNSNADSTPICLIYDTNCRKMLCGKAEKFAQYYDYQRCA